MSSQRKKKFIWKSGFYTIIDNLKKLSYGHHDRDYIIIAGFVKVDLSTIIHKFCFKRIFLLPSGQRYCHSWICL